MVSRNSHQRVNFGSGAFRFDHAASGKILFAYSISKVEPTRHAMIIQAELKIRPW